MFGFKSRSTKQIGDEAERLACQYLENKGLTLVEKNYRIKGGEIDLVMRDNQHLVFIEVRCRNNANYGSGAETVDGRKQARLIKAATVYLLEKSSQATQPARFDVMSISAIQHSSQSSSRPQPEIEWIKDAFQA